MDFFLMVVFGSEDPTVEVLRSSKLKSSSADIFFFFYNRVFKFGFLFFPSFFCSLLQFLFFSLRISFSLLLHQQLPCLVV